MSLLENDVEFRLLLEKFKRFLFNEDKEEIFSFNSGFLKETEGYKKEISKKSATLLQTEAWDESIIGSGKIFHNVSAALKYNPPGHQNNLVDYHQKQHFDNVKNSQDRLWKIEKILFTLYTSDNDEKVHNTIVKKDYLGGKYDLISYLFFLKNSKRYLPTRPERFEEAFSRLSINFKMRGQCSWTNYCTYINIISEIRERLAPFFEEKIELLDAHSFCWVLGYKPEILTIDLNSPKYSNPLLILTDVPKSQASINNSSNGNVVFNPSHVDWTAKEEVNSKIGLTGEIYVLEAERNKLIKNGLKKLADKIEHISVTKGDGAGYDIRSYSLDGEEIFIEVKTTTKGKNTHFIITEKELQFSKHNHRKYYLYRLYDFKSDQPNKYFTIHGDLRKMIKLLPIQYYAML